MPNCVNMVLQQTEAAACLPTTPCNIATKEQLETPEKHIWHQQTRICQWEALCTWTHCCCASSHSHSSSDKGSSSGFGVIPHGMGAQVYLTRPHGSSCKNETRALKGCRVSLSHNQPEDSGMMLTSASVGCRCWESLHCSMQAQVQSPDKFPMRGSVLSAQTWWSQKGCSKKQNNLAQKELVS